MLLISAYISFSNTSISLEYKEILMDVSTTFFFCDYGDVIVSRMRGYYDPRSLASQHLALASLQTQKRINSRKPQDFTQNKIKMLRPLAPKHLQSLFLWPNQPRCHILCLLAARTYENFINITQQKWYLHLFSYNCEILHIKYIFNITITDSPWRI